MISDVLADAEVQIKDYLEAYPKAYAWDADNILELLQVMQDFRLRPGYDLPPERKE